MAVEENLDGKVTKLIVKFDNPKAGQAAREKYPLLKKRYPGGTIITPKAVLLHWSEKPFSGQIFSFFAQMVRIWSDFQ